MESRCIDPRRSGSECASLRSVLVRGNFKVVDLRLQRAAGAVDIIEISCSNSLFSPRQDGEQVDFAGSAVQSVRGQAHIGESCSGQVDIGGRIGGDIDGSIDRLVAAADSTGWNRRRYDSVGDGFIQFDFRTVCWTGEHK